MKIFKKMISKLGIKQADCFCPVCGTSDVLFSPLPEMYRQNAEKFSYVHFGKGEMTALDTYLCSTCGASDRERLYAYWIRQQVSNGIMPRSIRVIHFSPELGLSALIQNSNFFDDYQTADLNNTAADHNVDLQNLPFENDSFDFFICSHILEHVQDDRKAICELFRITKPHGYGILMAPIIVGLEKTLEDPSITSGAERWRLFGQDDHVRLYSHNDYVNRIETEGFVLEQLGVNHFGENIFDHLGLKKTSILYIARKP